MRITEEWLEKNEACSQAVAYLRRNNLVGTDAITLLKKLKPRHLNYCIWGIGNCTDVHTLKRAIKIIDVNIRDSTTNISLHWACVYGRPETAKTLLEHGADINVKNIAGETPLHVASKFGRTEVAKILLKHGADVHVKSIYGNTLLYLANMCGHIELAKLLKEYGARV